ncbi:MAG TPA: zinc-binding dehydrogenase [Burkholderiaceae bacterium]|nr:zinc-binding dehydrogenase [Burkholderiaceae bacterium]
MLQEPSHAWRGCARAIRTACASRSGRRSSRGRLVFAYIATRQALNERAAALWQALADGTIQAPPIERHALDAAARAHERLESRATTGALVLIA